jgi:hypothetical protein
MRVAPAPLYNNASDVREFVLLLARVVRELRAEGGAGVGGGAAGAGGAPTAPA